MSALSAIYGGVARLRRSYYERHPSARRRLARPVVSVGNLTVGGSGKTPVVAALARILQQMGERPAILSRGYGRRRSANGVVVVSDGSRVLASVEASGDEPQMLASRLPGVPVLVAAERYLAGTLAERQFGATVMLLDDGFQHLQLERTVDLLVVAPEDLEERVLPSGRLREPLSAARAAHALLVYGTSTDAECVSGVLGVETTYTVSVANDALEPIIAGSAPAGRRVLAVAGIARPGRFFNALRDRGYEVVRETAFRDHHWYSAADVERISAAARDAQADLVVTTAKDAVRLAPLLSAGDASRWAVLPMSVAIAPAAGFSAWLAASLRHASGGEERL